MNALGGDKKCYLSMCRIFCLPTRRERERALGDTIRETADLRGNFDNGHDQTIMDVPANFTFIEC